MKDIDIFLKLYKEQRDPGLLHERQRSPVTGFFSLMIATILLTIIGLDKDALGQDQNRVQVYFPEVITVKLKDAGTISGLRLLKINTQTQKITLRQGDNTKSRDIASIESLAFSGRAIIRTGERRIVIRGGKENKGSCCGTSDTWTLPLRHFQFIDPTKVQVTLTSLYRGRQRDIVQISKTNFYIVDEIKFETPEKATLKDDTVISVDTDKKIKFGKVERIILKAKPCLCNQ